MLARLADELPSDGYLFEPKLDGFRCVVFRDGHEVELQSRHGNPLARYFPEIVTAVRGIGEERVVLDGEIVGRGSGFVDLMHRLHPAASRVERLAVETPAQFVAFDLLAVGDESLLEAPLLERRRRLEALLAGSPVKVGQSTARRDVASLWLETTEGVIAKPDDSRYLPGKRGWSKIKRRLTADCVVAGVRWRVERPLPSSLLLALYDEAGALEHVGVASSFGVTQARSLLDELQPHVVELAGHPWEHGFLVSGGASGRLRGAPGRWLPGMTMDWTPIAPVLVAEVSYDQVDARRFRHPARFVRWRRDRAPRSCTFDQLG